MTSAAHHDAAKLAVLGAGSLFVGNLFMTWERTVIRIPGAVAVHSSSSGWTAWGLVAGALALFLIGLVGARVERPFAMILCALGLLTATAFSVLHGSTGVTMRMPGLGVEVASTRWPAWVGLALAAIAAAGSLEAYRTSAAPATTADRSRAHPPAGPARPRGVT